MKARIKSTLAGLMAALCCAGAPALADCDFSSQAFRNELSDPSRIEHISVEIKKGRKWFKNSISIIASDRNFIEDIYKKRMSAKIIVDYDFGRCSFDARVRQNGDWKDHIKLLPGGNIISSLDVRLNEGNILNAVRFKLLLPRTRNGINEVFTAELLRQFDFVSPETMLVSADINGVRSTMLFQENAEKELLERMGRREGPIFEGDESILWDISGFGPLQLEIISLARMTNGNWAAKGPVSLEISRTAFAKLQAAYLDFAITEVVAVPNFFGTALDLAQYSDRANDDLYAIILDAVEGHHALRPSNRKFYFNSFTQSFEPIYYDGNTNLKFRTLGLSDQHLKDDIAAVFANADPSIVQRFKAKISQLGSQPEFRQRFLGRTGPERDTAALFFNDAMGTIQTRINERLDQNNGPTKDRKPHESSKFLEQRQELLARVKELGLPMELGAQVAATDGGFVVNAITPDGTSSTLNLSPIEMIDVITKNSLNDRRVVLLDPPVEDQTSRYRSEPFLDGHIVLSAGAVVQIDPISKVVNILQSSPNDWVLFRDTKIDDWRIALDGLPLDPNLSSEQRFNEYGLTGCVNFYNIDFDNTQIEARLGQCEDSINLVSSGGNLASLRVDGGFADAIDIDFAEIKIDRLEVLASGNDCFDVSSGRFEIETATLIGCGDKGISVGENSELRAKSVQINQAAIGVSSKDLSVAYIENFRGSAIDICAEAFQKKQEFGGGFLEIGNMDCEGQVQSDANSAILVNGQNQ